MFWSKKLSFNPASELNDLTGKVVIVTGASAGIGLSTVAHLARKGAKVYLGSRSEERGSAAIKKLEGKGLGSGKVVWFPCNLSDPIEAKRSADAFFKKEDRLDVLVNNAATSFDKTGESVKDGVTEMMMTNHVGTFAFTNNLLPLLIKTAAEPGSDVRIITLSSDTHRQGPAADPNLKFDTLEPFKAQYANTSLPHLSRYFVSKLANILFTSSLQRRLSSTSIVCISLHPGIVNTGQGDPLSPFLSFLFSVYFFFVGQHPDEGAWNSAFAAASPKVREDEERYKGAYLMPVGIVTKPSENAQKEELAEELWDTTDRYIGTFGVENS